MSAEQTTIVPATADGIKRAALALKRGQLVAFPTETVYGLGADARNSEAVANIFKAKGRPSFNPLIVHVGTLAQAQALCEWTVDCEALAAAFWPGPLSLVIPLRKGHGLSPMVTAGLDTVAVRLPAHPAARALLTAFDGPVAAPSANLSGKISPTTATHVLTGLSGQIAMILDDGPCTVGLESTIVGCNRPATLLRAGGVSLEAIERVLGYELQTAGDGQITAPGQMLSHYAPEAGVRLNAETPSAGEVFLGFGPMPCNLNLSATGDLEEAAARLFDALHELNAMGKPIAVAPIPMVGIGVAINDRLKRAAAPRPN